jgi:hypothetical protein
MSQPLHQLSLSVFTEIDIGRVNATPVTLLSSCRKQWWDDVDADDEEIARWLAQTRMEQ